MDGPVGVGESVMSVGEAEEEEVSNTKMITTEVDNDQTPAIVAPVGTSTKDEDRKPDDAIVVVANATDLDDQSVIMPMFSIVSSTPSKQTNYYTQEERDDQETVYYKLYDKLSLKHGAITSEMNRDRLGVSTTTLCYAEISLDVLRDVYNLMYQNGFSKEFGGKFYCIGAGMGKSTFAQLLLHDYLSVHGIEILTDMYVICEDVRKQFNEIKNDLCSHRKAECILRFSNADALSMDWHDADVTYIPATSFDSGMMKKIKTIVQKMKIGALVIILSKE